ncbi:hypothetical protein M404DRAFT_1000172 [Pisolithus tinctorius Marx 270]|uniref:Uncharacterized protein n=1 Tax=Pisolithus tinctorius Marx 270 TaxID=870435 RepID=A0A0C3J7Z2_PISTI|nr:hypothetical protein M404DRAFT_1000172 [Pisolithus tinctorius Marx 270]
MAKPREHEKYTLNPPHNPEAPIFKGILVVVTGRQAFSPYDRAVLCKPAREVICVD